MNDKVARDAKSLTELLDTWHEWCTHDLLQDALERARAAGDTDQAAGFEDVLSRMPEPVAALRALGAQHEVSRLLAGWEWHTVRAAREQGASWAEIAEATDTEPRTAHAAYLRTIDVQEQLARRYEHGLSASDAADYRAAAGQWHDELLPTTPGAVVEQIEDAIARDDQDTLDELRGRWWDPTRGPQQPTARVERTTTTAALGETPGAAADHDQPSPPIPYQAGPDHTAAHEAPAPTDPGTTHQIDESEARTERESEARTGRAEWRAAPRWANEPAIDEATTGVNSARRVTGASDDQATEAPATGPFGHAIESARGITDATDDHGTDTPAAQPSRDEWLPRTSATRAASARARQELGRRLAGDHATGDPVSACESPDADQAARREDHAHRHITNRAGVASRKPSAAGEHTVQVPADEATAQSLRRAQHAIHEIRHRDALGGARAKQDARAGRVGRWQTPPELGIERGRDPSDDRTDR